MKDDRTLEAIEAVLFQAERDMIKLDRKIKASTPMALEEMAENAQTIRNLKR